MSEADIVWASLLTAGAAYEAYGLHRNREATLSATVRRWAQTHTTAGKAVFAVGWSAFAVWFLGHIVGIWP